MPNTANYNEQGGARSVIGGELDVVGGEIDIEATGDFKVSGTSIRTKLAELAAGAMKVLTGETLAVESGGGVDIEAGGAFKSAGTDIADVLAKLAADTLLATSVTQLNAAAVNGLLGANVELVAAPAAGLAVVPVFIHMFLDHGGTDFVQVNDTDQLAIKYNGGAEIAELGSQAQCKTLLEASADAALMDPLNMDGFVPEAAKAIDLDNNGAAEYTTGDGTLSVLVAYRVVSMAAFGA